jgi:hypothetical protein
MPTIAIGKGTLFERSGPVIFCCDSSHAAWTAVAVVLAVPSGFAKPSGVGLAELHDILVNHEPNRAARGIVTPGLCAVLNDDKERNAMYLKNLVTD